MPSKLSDLKKHERLARLQNLLRLITEETALSATEVCERLESQGHTVSRKTITRDLEELPGLVATETTPRRFYISPDFKSDYQINFNEDELQIIVIALSELKQTAPKYFKQLAEQAERTLTEKLPKHLAREFAKLKGLSSAHPSLAGSATSHDTKAMETALKALRAEKVIECFNHSPYSPEKNKVKRLFGPLMLNMVGGVPYLLVHDPADEKNPVKNLRLSRLRSVVILEQKVDRSKLKYAKTMDLSFSGYGGTTEEIVEFEIVCRKNMGHYFMEREINHTQKLIPQGECFLLSFKSHPSLDLIRLLAGFGDEIISLKPATQLKRMKLIWQKAALP